MSKRKGSAGERSLIKLFWAEGWAAVRVAGSGSMHFPSPDILTGNKIRQLAIEAKVTKENKKYFSKEEIKQLINFASYFGAEPWLAIKFLGRSWVFVNPEDLTETEKSFCFEKENKKGLLFEELVGFR
jgi:Holliday junction resolvase